MKSPKLPLRHPFLAPLLFALAFTICQPISQPIYAQEGDQRAFPQLNGLEDLLGDAPPADADGKPISTSSRIVAIEGASWLQVAAELKSGWHLYSITQQPGGPKPTRIVLEPSKQYRLTGDFQADAPPTVLPADVFPVPEEYHEGRVVWTAPIAIADGVDPAHVRARGHLTGQVCEDGGRCMNVGPKETTFEAAFMETSATSDVATPPAVDAVAVPVAGSAAAPVDVAGDPEPREVASSSSLGETIRYLCIALLAGLILNLMPCVLPVIGLKVMSFAQQAGESPRRVLWLNVCFVAGLISVFLALAALAAFLGWGWGRQFQRPEFGIALISIVFVFALSLLGIWEIPIPGFVGTGKAAEMSEREGAAGAFFKGVLTTLLATPCSGPLLVPALTWAVLQPKPMIFATFGFMGLGMGLPYLLFGLSPALMRLLPKPGAWMETFKHIMGFVLLATVVWLFSSINDDYVVPTLGLIFTLWAACWWIGRTPITAATSTKLRAYLGAAVFAAAVGFMSFSLLLPSDSPWDPFTRASLDDFRNKGVPVFVDFTADW